MLVAFTGTQGCGKTTLLNALEEEGYNVIKRKTARSVLAEWKMDLSQIYSDRQLHMRFQDALLDRKIEDESQYVDTDEIWLTERSYTDLFVYTAMNLSMHNECDKWLNEYYAKCSNAQSFYNHVFYIPGGQFDVQADDVRGHNPHYAKMIEMMMEHYNFKMNPINAGSYIKTTDIEERVEEVRLELHCNKQDCDAITV